MARRQDAEAVGQGLQLAVAALLAEHAEVVALDEQHLDQAAAQILELLGLVLHDHALGDGLVQAACGRPLTSTVQTRQLPHGVRPFMAHRCGM